MTPPPLDLPQRLALVKFLTETLGKLRTGELVPDAQAGWPSGTKMPVIFGGKHAGWASMPKGSTSAGVSDPAKFLAWAQDNYPHHVTEDVAVMVTPKVIALLEEHLPGALVRTPKVDEHWTGDITKALKEKGCYTTRNNVELAEIPGITVSEKEPVPRVDWAGTADDAEAVILAAWRAGLIPLDGLLALTAAPAPAAEPEPEPPVATEAAEPAESPLMNAPPSDPRNRLFMDESGRFHSPETAALHAQIVQGGFSTPEIEARRMLEDARRTGDAGYAAMARGWLEANGLPVAADARDEPVSEPAP